MDRLLDQAFTGPMYLRQPSIADIVVEAINYNSEILKHYVTHAFVVMPNHVHILVTAAVPLPKLTKSLKGITAKRANVMLGLSGKPFWQEESYDHVLRHQGEFAKIRKYIEQNRCAPAWCGKRASIRGPVQLWGGRPRLRPAHWQPAGFGAD